MENCQHHNPYIRVLESIVTVEITQVTCADCGAPLEPKQVEA